MIESSTRNALEARLQHLNMNTAALDQTSSSTAGRAVHTDAIFQALGTEQKVLLNNDKKEMPCLGYYVTMFSSSCTFFPTLQHMDYMARGNKTGGLRPMEPGAYLTYFIPHRRVRPSAFRLSVSAQDGDRHC